MPDACVRPDKPCVGNKFKLVSASLCAHPGERLAVSQEDGICHYPFYPQSIDSFRVLRVSTQRFVCDVSTTTGTKQCYYDFNPLG